jgi:hypothetical protein
VSKQFSGASVPVCEDVAVQAAEQAAECMAKR